MPSEQHVVLQKAPKTDSPSILTTQSPLALQPPNSSVAHAQGQVKAIAFETGTERSTPTLSATTLDMEPSEITSFIQGHVWTFAKTMPQYPHWYVVKNKCRSSEEFERMVIHIRKFGYKKKFKSRYYTMFNWQTPDQDEPWKMWTMGAPLDQTIIINRTQLRQIGPLE